MSEKKEGFYVWLLPETSEMVNCLYKIDGCKSRSDFIDKAIRFYFAYLTSDTNKDYLSKSVSDSLKNYANTFENRMSKLLFKNSVEIAVLMNIVAATHNIDKEQIRRLRGECVEEIRKTKGTFDIEDAFDWQRGDDE